MKNHIKVFTRYFDIGLDDAPVCQYCNKNRLVDVHHLVFRSQNGKDNIDNLIGLCRTCHTEAHNNKEFNEQLKEYKLLNYPPF